MPISVAKKLVHYRNLLVALANAGITWVILIVAPLGLFAVILCTASVFGSSLILGAVADFALFNLLRPSGWEVRGFSSSQSPVDPGTNTVYGDSILQNRQRQDFLE